MAIFSTVNEVLLNTTFNYHPLIGLIWLKYWVLGKLSVPGCLADSDNSKAEVCHVAMGAGGGYLDIFFLSSVLSIFLLPLFERRHEID